MRTAWVLIGLSVLVSMAAVMVGFGQHTLMTKLLKQEADVTSSIGRLDAAVRDAQLRRDALQERLEEHKKTVTDLMEEIMKLNPEDQKKNSESEACRAEKRKMDEELTAAEKETVDTAATMKKEREAWTAELTSLQQQRAQRSKLCDFVRSDQTAQKLCAI